MVYLVSFCLAIGLTQWQSAVLPDVYMAFAIIFLLFLLIVGLLKRTQRPVAVMFASFILGFLYSNVMAEWRLNHQLAAEFEQKAIHLKVYINKTPDFYEHYWRTEALVIQSPDKRLRRVRLNWYQNLVPEPCAYYALVVKLKRPHGLRNPAGFAYKKYLLEKDIGATGYVKRAKLLGRKPFCIAKLRLDWRDYVLANFSQEKAAWIVALSTGDKSLISPEQYQFLQLSGITHLFVISGLHIGLIAFFVYRLILFLRLAGFGLVLKGDWRAVAGMFAFSVAVLYSVLSGFEVPAQRTVIMLWVFFAGSCLGFYFPVWLRYFLSMSLVLLINPLSVGNAGFVLSFAAVALLIICSEHWQQQQSFYDKFKVLFLAQFYIALGLSPFLFYVFQNASISGPLINLFAIPVVSFITTPMILMGFVTWLCFGHGFIFLNLAVQSLDWLFALMFNINEQVFSYLPAFKQLRLNYSQIIILTAFSLCLMLPRFLPKKMAWCLALVCVFFILHKPNTVAQGELQIKVLDVGQGLSVLLSTANHNLLYDTGAAWPRGSMAQSVLLPVLAYYGVNVLDKLVISHWDNDHSGGAEFIQNHFAVGQSLSPITKADFSLCQKPQSWQWDGVLFSAFSLQSDSLHSANQRSCILMIHVAGKTLLLPGDIDQEAESFLLKEHPLKAIDVLIAPHHGSKSSSSYLLSQKLKQGVVVFSTGYLNRYGHPHKLVIKKYQAVDAKLFNTAKQGMISIAINKDGIVKVSAFKKEALRYWDAEPKSP